jgi:formylglycine-generating enzyme required for sulfatase activity
MSEELQKAIKERAKAITVGAGDAAVELIRVEPGTFVLGSQTTEQGRLENEGPPRRVTLTQAFYLGKYPITQRQYTAVTGKNPVKPAGPDVAIDQVTYADAVAFCSTLSMTAGVNVALPTEAQWEYACRAGTTTRFWSGDRDEDLARVGWYRENSVLRAREVGKKPANPWGFHDMHGNVCEICRDALPVYTAIVEQDPIGRTRDTQGMMRGGGWMHPADYCRSAIRLMSSDRFGGAGLRIAIAG